MRVLVTGASGFIGSHVVRALIHSGHDVLCLVPLHDNLGRLDDAKDKFDVLRGDLKNVVNLQPELQGWKPETCVHLAWYAEPYQYLHSRENLYSLKRSLELLHALAGCGCEHFIGAGTCAEYEMKSEKLSEIDKTSPETLYAASKLSFQLLGDQIARQSKIRFAWGRIFSLYGPHEDARRLVPSAILSLLRGEVFSSSPGDQVRDYLHVTDVASAFLALVNHGAAGIHNICSSEPLTIRSLLNTIGDLIGRPDLLALGKLTYRDWEPSFICGENQRLMSLGWSAQVDLLAGLQDTIDWWKMILEKKNEIGN